MKLIHKGLICIQFIWLLSACNSESPQIHYTGISTESAVYLAKKSNSDAEVLAWVDRVKSDREPGFDWPIFWTTISEIRLLSRVSKPTQLKILELFPLQCDVETKNLQAMVIIDYPEFYGTLFGQKASCQSLVKEEVFSQVFDRMLSEVKRKDSNTAQISQIIVESLLHRISDMGSFQSVQTNLNKLNEVQWNQFVKNLIKWNLASHVSDFILVYEQVYGPDSLTSLLFKELVQDGEFFISFVENMGLLRAIDLLLKIPTQLVSSQQIQITQWVYIFDYLLLSFLKSEFPGRNKDEKLRNKFLVFLSFENLMLKWQTRFEMSYLLTMDDKLIRSMEASIKVLDNPQDFFSQFTLSLPISLLRYRTLRDIDDDTIDAIEKSIQNPSELERIALLRLRVNIMRDPKVAHEKVLDFCKLLEDNGVKSRKIKVKEFSVQDIESPGCVFIISDENTNLINLSGSSSVVSPNSVLLTGGISINISTLDGGLSVIDASTLREHPELTEEPPLPQDHALVFPVILGFKIETETELLDRGIYYIPYHFVYRRAVDGRPAQTQPARGFPGGNVNIEISDPTIAPQIISYGGIGQKPVPPRKGGNGDTSTFNWSKLSELLSVSEQDPKGLARSKIRPSISLLDHILSHASLTEGEKQIRVFVNSSALLESLESDQKEKYFNFCNEKYQTLQECVYDITLKSAIQMNEQLQKALLLNSPSFVLPQMASDEFSVEAGKMGVINQAGEQGENGKINISGSEQ